MAEGVPAGLGEPIYGKLDSDLAAAMMTITVKGVEIGDGCRRDPGHEAADEMRMDGDTPIFSRTTRVACWGASRSASWVRFAVKPTSSILTPRRSVDKDANEVDVITRRHDPCVGIRQFRSAKP